MSFAFTGCQPILDAMTATRVALLHRTRPTKAGFFFVRDGHVLVLRRVASLSEPLTWGLPGGHLEAGETPLEGAVRECEEEIGGVPRHTISYADVHQGYATFFADVFDRFIPVLNWEHDAWQWRNLDQIGPDPHPHLPRLTAIAREKRTSY